MEALTSDERSLAIGILHFYHLTHLGPPGSITGALFLNTAVFAIAKKINLPLP